jgi:hypothetical protein
MMVEKQRGDWVVAVAQNTNRMTGPNPELDLPPIDAVTLCS